MKKQIRGISNSAAGVLMAGIFFSASALFAQAPIAQKSDVWSLTYRISAIGDFTVEPELGTEGPMIFYHIKRIYEGKSILYFVPYADQLQLTVSAFKDPSTETHITVDDFKHTVYDDICGDFESVEEKWTADVSSSMGGGQYPQLTSLVFNNEKHNYSTVFPIKYQGESKVYDDKIKYVRKEISNLRTGVKKIKPWTEKKLPFSSHNYPTVKGFIENGNIVRHAVNWSELKKEETGDGFYWVSEVLYPDAPLIDGVPESQNVGIVIQYSFKKMAVK
jgi:hypothetical protein